MKVSLNFVQQLIDFELPAPKELVKKIGAQLGEVESVENLGDKYKGISIVKVVECAKLENSDHLNICQIDDGGANQNVERLENGLVQVLTGAPNIHSGMWAVWLAPGVTVPESFDKDPFVLTSREMRGSMSHGMLASPRELAIGGLHEGLLEIYPDFDLASGKTIKPGDDFAETFGLNDTVIDIENKMFTHRPDCFGQLGVAREISAILKGLPKPGEALESQQFVNPDWYSKLPQFEPASGLELEVTNEATDKVPRFMAVAMKDVEIKSSPLWLQIELVRLGGKPINNVVDITNYLMLVTAQPTHAYDWDKLRGGRLGVRMARKGETVALLNGKSYELEESDIVIADGEGVIGLAGIMGGLDSEVTSETKNIVLEVATFDMYCVRKSSMRHGLFTDALTRFNKGQSPLQNSRVLNNLMTMMGQLAGASQASRVFDEPTRNWNAEASIHGEIRISADFINSRLGLSLTASEIEGLLRRVNFAVRPSDDDKGSIVITVPFWRTDIELPEDIVEEVGRLYGYDKLPLELPSRSIKPANKNHLLEVKARIRQSLGKAGANEVLTYSFVHGDLLDKVGQDADNAFKLTNALSPDLQYYRLSLIPSLLEKIHSNIKAGYDEFALFEIGKAHIKDQLDGDELPREDELTALVVAASDRLKKSGAAYYQARKYLVDLLGVKPTFKPVPSDMQKFDITKPFDMNRTAFVYEGETFIGLVGEFRAQVARLLKLPKYCAGFELDTVALAEVMRNQASYVEQPKFPKVEQDISLKLPYGVSYQTLYDCLWSALAEVQPENTLPSLGPRDIYQKEDDKDHKQIALHFEIASYDKTMTTTEVAKMLDHAALVAEKQLGAVRL
jgi:phenylalanyl-tRNA synthetase beta chain